MQAEQRSVKEEEILGRKARNSNGQEVRISVEPKENKLASLCFGQWQKIRYDVNDFKNSGLKTTHYKTTLVYHLCLWSRRQSSSDI